MAEGFSSLAIYLLILLMVKPYHAKLESYLPFSFFQFSTSVYILFCHTLSKSSTKPIEGLGLGLWLAVWAGMLLADIKIAFGTLLLDEFSIQFIDAMYGKVKDS